MTEKYYPKEANLGQGCSFWNLGNFAAECCYPKYELQGRTTCRGIIDDVCLYVKDGRQPQVEAHPRVARAPTRLHRGGVPADRGRGPDDVR